MAGITSLSTEVEEKLAALELMAETLGLDNTTPSSYMTALVELSENLLTLGTVNVRLAMTEDELRDALAQVQHSRRLIQRWNQEAEDKNSETETFIRRTKALQNKAREYQERLDSLQGDSGGAVSVAADKAGSGENSLSVTRVMEMREELRTIEEDVKRKRARVRAYQGLPPNLAQAKDMVRAEKERQMALFDLRERLMSRMAVE